MPTAADLVAAHDHEANGSTAAADEVAEVFLGEEVGIGLHPQRRPTERHRLHRHAVASSSSKATPQ